MSYELKEDILIVSVYQVRTRFKYNRIYVKTTL